jgi:Fe-S cluster assembly iron-binding protein IscA
MLGDDTKRVGDRRRRNGPIEVVVDGVSARILEGAHVDVGEPGASGLRPPIAGRTSPLEFLIRDLPAKDVCGCGESFAP